jgi:hypothetical protein
MITELFIFALGVVSTLFTQTICSCFKKKEPKQEESPWKFGVSNRGIEFYRHVRYPIWTREVRDNKKTCVGWDYAIGRTNKDTIFSEQQYWSHQHAQEDALKAYFEWELQQSEKMLKDEQ